MHHQLASEPFSLLAPSTSRLSQQSLTFSFSLEFSPSPNRLAIVSRQLPVVSQPPRNRFSTVSCQPCNRLSTSPNRLSTPPNRLSTPRFALASLFSYSLYLYGRLAAPSHRLFSPFRSPVFSPSFVSSRNHFLPKSFLVETNSPPRLSARISSSFHPFVPSSFQCSLNC